MKTFNRNTAERQILNLEFNGKTYDELNEADQFYVDENVYNLEADFYNNVRREKS